MNDWQLYELYESIPLRPVGLKRWSRLYPEYVKLTGRACCAPHPHRHYTFEEFVEKLYEDPNFKNVILNNHTSVVQVNKKQQSDIYNFFKMLCETIPVK